jgi:predicted transcriptional regulator
VTEKEIVLQTIRALPDDCSLEEIAERVEFMAAVQKGLDQLDAGEGIPHEEVKKQLASWWLCLKSNRASESGQNRAVGT